MHESMILKLIRNQVKRVILKIERIKVEDKQIREFSLRLLLTHTARLFGREDDKACVLVCLLKNVEELEFS